MSRQQKILVPKLSPGCSSFQLSGSFSLNRTDEEKPTHRVFRTKRKHVQRACDRCRVKKSKCDGNQPCSRWITYNHACIFRDRKATQEKVYSRGFVEMLISQHAVHLQALRDLYKRCVTREGFPGSPLQESVQGYPGTHAILDRLGLVKHAEETIEDPQRVLADIVDYLKSLDTTSESLDCAESTDTSDTTGSGDPSPEPSTPREVSESSMPSIDYTSHGMPQSRQLCHTYESYEPLQQQHANVAPSISPVSAGDSCAFRSNNTSPPEVPWNSFPPQARHMPAATDAACQRTGFPPDMQWPAMASHPPFMPINLRSDSSGTPLYMTGQTFFPDIYGYPQLFSTGSSS